MQDRLGWKIYFGAYALVAAWHVSGAVNTVPRTGIALELLLMVLLLARCASIGLYAWRKRAFNRMAWRTLCVFGAAYFLFYTKGSLLRLIEGARQSRVAWLMDRNAVLAVYRFAASTFFVCFAYLASFLYAFRSQEIWPDTLRGSLPVLRR